MSRLPVPATFLSNLNTKHSWSGTATLDPNSTDNLLHSNIINHLALKPSLQAATVAPGTTNQGMIETYTVNVKTKVNDTEAFIFLEGKGKLPGDVVLGIDWMARTGAVVDWGTGKIESAVGGSEAAGVSRLSRNLESADDDSGGGPNVPNGYNPQLARGGNNYGYSGGFGNPNGMRNPGKAGLLGMAQALNASASARARRGSSPPSHDYDDNDFPISYSFSRRASPPLNYQRHPYRTGRNLTRPPPQYGLHSYIYNPPFTSPPDTHTLHIAQQRKNSNLYYSSRYVNPGQGAAFYGEEFNEHMNWDCMHPQHAHLDWCPDNWGLE